MSLLRFLFWWLFRRKEAVRLNARIEKWSHRWGDWNPFWWWFEENDMAQIGDKFRVFVKPTNAAGGEAPVFDLEFTEASEQYDFVEFDTDLSAVFVAVKSGPATVVTVKAKSKSGAELSEAVDLVEVELPPVDEEAIALNAGVEPFA